MGKSDKKNQPGKKIKRTNTYMLAALAAIVLGALAYNLIVPATYSAMHDKVGGETGKVLPSTQFSGIIGYSYELAAAFPEVMDKMYCYCRCDREPYNHKSLLTCFTNDHGAT